MIDYSPKHWWRHLFDLNGSVVKETAGRIAGLTLWSCVAVVVDRWVFRIDIAETMHSLVGIALGLLLVFRTNSSYDRFWEGRKQWGAIVNESRNLARQARAHLAAAPELTEAIIRWISVFNFATLHRLRGTRPVFGSSAAALPSDDLRRVEEAQHPPLAAAVQLTSVLAEARRRGVVSDYVMLALDQNVQLLVDFMGACERIHRTPLPFAYMVHLRRAVLLYLITLPIALVEPFGFVTIPATAITAFVFFGIEEIGVEIEDPFGTDENDLPLEQICQNIENNVMALLPRSRPAA